MREKIVFVLSLSIIGLSFAHITPPYDGCTWGILHSELLIEPGSVITDAVLTIENIRPEKSCLNPTLYIQLLDNPKQGLIQIPNQKESIQTVFEIDKTPALVAQWKLNEYSGFIASDSSGNENHGSLINNPVWIAGDGLSFQSKQYLEIPDSKNLNITSPLAVSLWIKMRSGSRYAKLLIKPFESRSDPWELYALDLGSDGYTPRFLLSDGIPNGQYSAAYNSGFKIIPDQWYHIAGTYDGRKMQLYVDGQLIAQAETNLQIGANSMPLCIGGRLGSDTFNGIISDVRIYGNSLGTGKLQINTKDNFFEPHGTCLKEIRTSDLQGPSPALSFSLQEIEDQNSWIYEIDPRPLSLSLPNHPVPLLYSSSMLELMDYAGTGKGFGIGFDSDGFLFDKIKLTVTTESYRHPGPPQTRTFDYKNLYAPVIFIISNVVAEPGQIISFPVSVLERDQNPYTVSIKNLPPGAIFSNQIFTWTPALEQKGLWTITIEATDGVMTKQRDVKIEITDPTPIFSPVENPVIYELQTLNLQIRAVDLAGGPVPIAASGLPANASFDGSTLQWRPLYGQSGTYEITFSASNEIRLETIKVMVKVLPYRPPKKPILIL